MLIFSWDDNLNINIDLLDRQHREILDKANTFFIAYKGGAPQKRLLECLDFLQHYVLYHFQAEEAFQAECDYTQMREHQAMHQRIKMQFKFHSTTLQETGFSQESINNFYVFLREWIKHHMLVEDAKFAQYYTEYSQK